MKIFILRIARRNGNDYWAFSDYEMAIDRLARWVRSRWNNVDINEAPPAEHSEPILEYFNRTAEGLYQIAEVELGRRLENILNPKR